MRDCVDRGVRCFLLCRQRFLLHVHTCTHHLSLVQRISFSEQLVVGTLILHIGRLRHSSTNLAVQNGETFHWIRGFVVILFGVEICEHPRSSSTQLRRRGTHLAQPASAKKPQAPRILSQSPSFYSDSIRFALRFGLPPLLCFAALRRS